MATYLTSISSYDDPTALSVLVHRHRKKAKSEASSEEPKDVDPPLSIIVDASMEDTERRRKGRDGERNTYCY